MSTKKLDDLYAEYHQIKDDIKLQEAVEVCEREQYIKDLIERETLIRLNVQHRKDILSERVWVVVFGVLGIGLGLLFAWIF